MPFIQAKSVQGTATSITTPSFTSTSGHFLAVGVGNDSITPSGSPVTDNKGNTFPNAWVGSAGSSGARAACYYAENIAGGASHTVTYAPGGNIACVLGIAEFDDVITSSSLDQTATATKTIPGSPSLQNHTSGLTAQTAQATELLIGVGMNDTGATVPASIEAFQDVVALGDTGPEGVTLGFIVVHAVGTYSYAANGGSVGLATFKTGANPMFVQSKSAQGNGVTSITTAAFTSTAGNFLATVVSDFGRTITGTPVSDSQGNTYQQGFAPQNTGIHRVGNYYAENITGGASHTVTFALAGSGFSGLAVAEFSGVNTSSTLDQSASANATSVTLGGATAQADELLIGGIGNGNNGNPFGSTSQYASTFTDDVALTGTNTGLILSHRYVTQQNKYAFSAKDNNNQTEPHGIATFKLVLAATGSGDVTAGADQVDGSGSVTNPTFSGSGDVTIGPDAIAGSGSLGIGGSGGVTIGPDQISGDGPADARVTQDVAEVFGDATSDARVTAALAEAFGSKPGIAMVTETIIEVFGIGAPPILDPPGGGAVPPGDDPTPDDSMCGARTPLFYCEIQTPDGVKSYSWTDQPINDPSIQRLPRIVNISTLKRQASDETGAPVISAGTLSLIDHDGTLRALHVAGKLTRSQIDFYMVDDDGRRLGDAPFRCGQAILTQAETSQHVVDLAFEGRFGGIASRVVLNKPLPFRRFTAAFNPTLPTKLAGKGQPIPYGVLSDEVARFPTVHVHYTGTRRMPNGEDWYEGYIAGAATWGPIDAWGADGRLDADGRLMQVKLPAALFDTDIAMPNYGALWTSWFGAARYLVYDGMRHTVMYLRPGSVVGEAFKAFAEGKAPGAPSDGTTSWGAVPVHVNMGGVEETGDGSGPLVISSPPRQIQHLVTNCVEQTHDTDANWYPVPVTANATPYAVIDTVSVETVKARMAARFGGGYESAFVIGHDLERETFGTWLQRICLGVDVQVAENRHGQLKLGMEDPSAGSVKAFTITKVLKGTYRTWRDDGKRANAITVSTFKNYMLTNDACRLRDSSPPQPADFLTAPRPFTDDASIDDHGGDPVGREEFVYEDWVTRDVTLHIPDDVAGYYLRRRTNGVDMHVLETDLCGLDVDVFDNFDITHDEGMVSTTRKVRCMTVELDPPNPHRRTWMVRLTGYDVTDLPA